MKRLFGILTILVLVALAAGCGKPSEKEAAIEERLDEKGTVDLMDEVAKAPDYQPPAAGHLTEKQVEMYLDVRRREQKIRQVALKNLKEKGDEAEQEKRDVGLYEAMKAVGDIADVATADLRAAQELGHNPKEYQWVKAQVHEAQMMEATRGLSQQVNQSRAQLLAMLENQRKSVKNPEQQAELDRQIEQFKKNAPMSQSDGSMAQTFNADLLTRYQAEFAELRAEDQRLSQELQKSGSTGSGS